MRPIVRLHKAGCQTRPRSSATALSSGKPHGDTVETWIEGIGTIRNRLVAPNPDIAVALQGGRRRSVRDVERVAQCPVEVGAGLHFEMTNGPIVE